MKMANEEKWQDLVKGWNIFETLVIKFKEKCIEIAKKARQIAKDDPRRIIHSLKMGLSLTLVSLFYYLRPLYDEFGVAGMWTVLTVVVVFEFSVGATISKGVNRGGATLIAGALGVGAQHLAILFGKKAEPIALGFFVFLLASVSTFTRFFPRIRRKYDYGVLIFISTFSLVSISGYRVNMIISLAYQRLIAVLLGVATCIIVSICICPVWAGNDLHILIVHNIVKLADSLEGVGEEYIKFSQNDMSTLSTEVGNKSLQSHRSVLTSKNNEESLANFAQWEPFHGRFKLRHPWKQYPKIGALTRQCAYQIEALSTFFTNEAKAPTEFRRNVKDSCTKMSIELSQTLRAMASSIEHMINTNSAEIHLKNSKEASEELQNTLKSICVVQDHDLSDATILSILIHMVDIVEKLLEAVYELGRLAHFKSVEPTVSRETKLMARVHRKIVNLVHNGGKGGEVIDHVDIVICVQEPPKDGGCIVVDEIIGIPMPIA